MACPLLFGMQMSLIEKRPGDEAFRRILADLSPDSIVVANRDGRIAFVNKRAEVLLGYRSDELLGQPVELLIPEPLRTGHEAHRAGFMASQRSRPMGAGLDLHARRKDGSALPVDISIELIDVDGEPCIACVIRDISEHRRLLDELTTMRRSERSHATGRAKQRGVHNGREALIAAYQRVLAGLLNRRTCGKAFDSSRPIRQLARSLADRDAGPRDAVEIHAAAIKAQIAQDSLDAGPFYMEEGRFVLIELLGALVLEYRRRYASAIQGGDE